MQPITGSCLCGALKYSCSSEAVLTAACHCRTCQRSTGSAFSVVAAFQRSDVTMTGDAIQTYEDVGDSGQPTYRHFCAKCGTTVGAEMAAQPALTFIQAGTLDHPEAVTPQLHVYWRDHQNWIQTIDALPKHNTMPSQ